MAEGGDEFDFAFEAATGFAGGEGAFEENLDGDAPVGGDLGADEDDALAAARKFGEVFVTGDGGQLGGGAVDAAHVAQQVFVLAGPIGR